jgi:hypothetical protein
LIRGCGDSLDDERFSPALPPFRRSIVLAARPASVPASLPRGLQFPNLLDPSGPRGVEIPLRRAQRGRDSMRRTATSRPAEGIHRGLARRSSPRVVPPSSRPGACCAGTPRVCSGDPATRARERPERS